MGRSSGEEAKSSSSQEELDASQNEAEVKVESVEVLEEFPDLAYEENLPTEMGSLCMNCQEEGVTKFLLVTIPFFKQIIVSAFACPHCHYSNNEVAPAGDIQPKGIRYKFLCSTSEDTNRSIVKSHKATLRVEELDFEIPPETQKGSLSTIEGVLLTAATGLKEMQPLRKIQTPEVHEKIQEIIKKLKLAAKGELPVTITLDDPTGNSHLQNPNAPGKDEKVKETHYVRSHAQDEYLGLISTEAKPSAAGNTEGAKASILSEGAAAALSKALEENEDARQSVLSMPCDCNSCHTPGQLNMHSLDIPYFKEVIIMAFSCDYCGFRSNEVKAGGGTAERGVRHVLKCRTIEDLNRDVLKSETAAIMIPELNLEVVHGSLGGRFSTIEGLLEQVKTELKNNPWIMGDSALGNTNTHEFYKKYDQMLAMEQEFTFILDDPLGNSFVQNLYAPDPDPNMQVEEYERTFEMNETLGLNDMVTENYYDESESEKDQAAEAASASES